MAVLQQVVAIIGTVNLLVLELRCLLVIRKPYDKAVYRYGDLFITSLLIIPTVTALVFTQTDLFIRRSVRPRGNRPSFSTDDRGTAPSIPGGIPLTVMQFMWLHAVCHQVLFVDTLRMACLSIGILSPIRNLCLILFAALVRPVVQKVVLFSIFLDYALLTAGIGWMSFSVPSHLSSRRALRRRCYAGAAMSLAVLVAAVVAWRPEFRLICTEAPLLIIVCWSCRHVIASRPQAGPEASSVTQPETHSDNRDSYHRFLLEL
ncbi:hypothetical protein PISL3812_09901 [Talaromyces islandicus]|uniref:Uncharacterized protein n=1 Tax=Talaromyces islandicus TaxID=28573 RepID=A0A0U1MCT7_TALIS|nr:hypothetical protein PISL3812_09901 [Talaromyces islandicus]